ncbi:DNA repair protein RecO [Aquimarina hainanensis]|uniref:DNA repair protein RecO n=1 Tax=Aquimarina hainanensis TaxID=1578017 RepID=A0ABW5N8F6_9FLAO|nr:DNA repair protein RecO [Aquimarina sp. TRL1]QKX04908.1 DNA repair protein RecO [Aquimarina sp. TRL1]
MVVTTAAIVIHSLRYGEADLIVTLFTRKYGVRSYLLKGVLKSKKGKLRAALFQPLTLLDIEAVHKDKNTLERIKEAKVRMPYQTLHLDFVKTSMVFFISEMLKSLIQEEETNEELYEYLETTFLWLDAHDQIGNFHIIFLIKLMQYLGCYPDISQMQFSWFNMYDGCFQSISTDAFCVEGVHVEAFKEFFGMTFEGSMNIKLTKKVRKDILNMILGYFELHLQGFSKPKSLSIINEIFR